MHRRRRRMQQIVSRRAKRGGSATTIRGDGNAGTPAATGAPADARSDAAGQSTPSAVDSTRGPATAKPARANAVVGGGAVEVGEDGKPVSKEEARRVRNRESAALSRKRKVRGCG